MWWWLIPVLIVGTALVLFGLLVLLGRFRGGALLRPVIERLARIGFMRRLFQRMSTAAIERQNPELASALKKMSSPGVATNQLAAQKALSRLTPAERRAYLEAAQEQASVQDSTNRQMRRQLERQQQQTRGGGSSARGDSASAGRPGAPKRKRKR